MNWYRSKGMAFFVCCFSPILSLVTSPYRSFLDITCESFFWLGYKSKTIGSYGLVDGLSNDCQVFSNYSSWSDDQCTTYFNYGPEINFGPCLANQLPFMCQYRPSMFSCVAKLSLSLSLFRSVH